MTDHGGNARQRFGRIFGELVQFPVGDGDVLQAFIVRPGGGVSNDGAEAVIIHLHGRGMEFYLGTAKWIPEELADHPFVHVSLNLRCHSGLYNIEPPRVEEPPYRLAAGAILEDFDEGDEDVATAIEFAHQEFGLPVFVAGWSLGGFYVATGCRGRSDVAGRICMSPVLDHKAQSWSQTFGSDGEKLDAITLARERVAAGRGHEILWSVRETPFGSYSDGIGFKNLLARATEADDAWLHAMGESSSPVLMIWGETEHERSTRADLFRPAFEAMKVQDKEMFEIPGAGHHYIDAERAVAERVANFVSRRLVSRS